MRRMASDLIQNLHCFGGKEGYKGVCHHHLVPLPELPAHLRTA